MPFGDEGLQGLTGLALSGGGFRATLFHLGSLWRLNELKYLPQLDRISSVSGGSITSGLLASKWTSLSFVDGEAANFVDQIVAPLREFCSRTIDVPAIGEGYLGGLLKQVTGGWLSIPDISQRIESDYQGLFGSLTLQEIPDRPAFIFNSTNFATGVDFRFSKPYAGDYRIGYIPNPTFAVAFAVTASSAFPPVLSPVVRTVDPDGFLRWEGADLFDDVEYKSQLTLTDGGVYDNLGLETVEKRCNTLLVSDAGGLFGIEPDPSREWVKQSLRAFDVATAQSRALRKRRLLADLTCNLRKGAYWATTTHIGGYQLPDALPVSAESTQYISTLRTRLNSFSDEEQCRLINGGYALCDAAMRKFVLTGPAANPPAWPYPRYAL